MLEVSFLDLGERSEGYIAALFSSRAKQLVDLEEAPRRVSRPGSPLLLCLTLHTRECGPLESLILDHTTKYGLDLVWADSTLEEL